MLAALEIPSPPSLSWSASTTDISTLRSSPPSPVSRFDVDDAVDSRLSPHLASDIVAFENVITAASERADVNLPPRLASVQQGTHHHNRSSEWVELMSSLECKWEESTRWYREERQRYMLAGTSMKRREMKREDKEGMGKTPRKEPERAQRVNGMNRCVIDYSIYVSDASGDYLPEKTFVYRCIEMLPRQRVSYPASHDRARVVSFAQVLTSMRGPLFPEPELNIWRKQGSQERVKRKCLDCLLRNVQLSEYALSTGLSARRRRVAMGIPTKEPVCPLRHDRQPPRVTPDPPRLPNVSTNPTSLRSSPHTDKILTPIHHLVSIARALRRTYMMTVAAYTIVHSVPIENQSQRFKGRATRVPESSDISNRSRKRQKFRPRPSGHRALPQDVINVFGTMRCSSPDPEAPDFTVFTPLVSLMNTSGLVARTRLARWERPWSSVRSASTSFPASSVKDEHSNYTWTLTTGPGVMYCRVRPIANPVYLRLKAVQNVLSLNCATNGGDGHAVSLYVLNDLNMLTEKTVREDAMGSGRERVYGLAWKGRRRSLLSASGLVC